MFLYYILNMFILNNVFNVHSILLLMYIRF